MDEDDRSGRRPRDEPSTKRLLVSIQGPAPAPPAGRLVAVEGTAAGRRWDLGAFTVIGRDPGCEIALHDDKVSRRHAVLATDGEAWLLRDVGSRNGTHVNGTRVEEQRIRVGDRVLVGDTLLVLTLVDPLHDRLAERQKLEAIARLARGVAHDLNNVFTPILGLVEDCEASPRATLGDTEIRAALADARAATLAGMELMQRLLAFARPPRDVVQTIDLAAFCAELVDFARHAFDRLIRIEVSVPDGAFVLADAARLQQAVLTLLLHAHAGLHGPGTIRLSARRVEQAPPVFVRLTIEAHGAAPSGHPSDEIELDGFELTLVRDALATHGGALEIETPTRFVVALPVEDGRGPQPGSTGGV